MANQGNRHSSPAVKKEPEHDDEESGKLVRRLLGLA